MCFGGVEMPPIHFAADTNSIIFDVSIDAINHPYMRVYQDGGGGGGDFGVTSLVVQKEGDYIVAFRGSLIPFTKQQTNEEEAATWRPRMPANTRGIWKLCQSYTWNLTKYIERTNNPLLANTEIVWVCNNRVPILVALQDIGIDEELVVLQ